jgi:hypothetical protein
MHQRSNFLYCDDPWCDGDHALPSQTCEESASPSTNEPD